MLSGSINVLDLIILAFFLALLRDVNQRLRRRGLPYPPGPAGLPFIGNLFNVPKEAPWATYADWAKTYGDVMSLKILGQVVVVVQSSKALKDLLDNKRGIYSDRPVLPFYEMTGLGGTGYFRQHVQMNSGEMGARAKTHEFLKRLLAQPNDFYELIEHLQGAIIMSLVYGYNIEDKGDKYLDTAREFGTMTRIVLLPGAALVNELPFLKHFPEWLPGMGFKALARKGWALGQEVITGPLAFVKECMVNGTARPSMALEALQECPSAQDEQVIGKAMGSIHSAGADTTVSALLSLFLMLVLYPAVQQKAQAELDAVTGGVLPDYEHRRRLPYIEAICKELLRWRMVAPASLPHATSEDDVYNGYFIPKGSIVIANAWAILHDPALYPDPEVFNPERFLTEDGQVVDDPLLSAAFGFGKRICPGRHIVDGTLFIVVASVLATFNVSKIKDEYGNEIPVEDRYVGSVLSQPAPFKCSITPRNLGVFEGLDGSIWGWKT
ncbi:cytochrome P450 [Artomyces pyxidatus]|uniref:Cytochrome P450 n=1 Tax=Artomyces pyxidatus TaxID=48021 RepID=A0ACB8TEQ4_9AGAM|nr:cytochrome P450 [Artomyces pyxidatus]